MQHLRELEQRHVVVLQRTLQGCRSDALSNTTNVTDQLYFIHSPANH